ncbi:MAG: CsbD family protein [Actinobacteria bacterium]|nr:CsbD family protein [Actinomycetota bacterium]
MSDQDADKMKGTAKEAVGKLTGSDELANEGEAQQEKAEHREEAEKAEQKEQEHQGS